MVVGGEGGGGVRGTTALLYLPRECRQRRSWIRREVAGRNDGDVCPGGSRPRRGTRPPIRRREGVGCDGGGVRDLHLREKEMPGRKEEVKGRKATR